MSVSWRYLCRISLVFVLSLSVLIPQTLSAQGSSVTASELRDAVRKSAATRQQNLDQVHAFFGDPTVRTVLNTAHIDAKRIEKTVSTMEPGELAKLAARTAQIQNDFAAGALNNQELTYIIIALGAAVLVLIVVAA